MPDSCVRRRPTDVNGGNSQPAGMESGKNSVLPWKSSPGARWPPRLVRVNSVTGRAGLFYIISVDLWGQVADRRRPAGRGRNRQRNPESAASLMLPAAAAARAHRSPSKRNAAESVPAVRGARQLPSRAHYKRYVIPAGLREARKARGEAPGCP